MLLSTSIDNLADSIDHVGVLSRFMSSRPLALHVAGQRPVICPPADEETLARAADALDEVLNGSRS